MIEVEFKNVADVEDEFLTYAVIVSRYRGKWIYCKHRERDTWEIPAGRREPGEAILDTAKRELFEESGALEFRLTPVCACCVNKDTKSYGLLCYADIHSLGQLPPLEIERIQLFEDEPDSLTYPYVQSLFFTKIKNWLIDH